VFAGVANGYEVQQQQQPQQPEMIGASAPGMQSARFDTMPMPTTTTTTTMIATSSSGALACFQCGNVMSFTRTGQPVAVACHACGAVNRAT
jgi:hypothetical protein